MEATLKDMMINQFRYAEEYAYHLEQSTNFMENQIVWESRQEDIRRSKPQALVFYGPQRNPIEPPRQNQRKVRNNPEDYFSDHKITEVVIINNDQQYGLDFMKQIIVMRENNKPDSFSEADLNKGEKRVMCLVEIVKFCDATLERVLKEVKLKIFQTEC
ncbi:hypothetical protein Tco_1366543 [Tanacetum coccineum]